MSSRKHADSLRASRRARAPRVAVDMTYSRGGVANVDAPDPRGGIGRQCGAVARRRAAQLADWGVLMT